MSVIYLSFLPLLPSLVLRGRRSWGRRNCGRGRQPVPARLLPCSREGAVEARKEGDESGCLLLVGYRGSERTIWEGKARR